MLPSITGERDRIAGICRSFGPQIMPTTPRMMLPMPNVTMTIAMKGRPIMGRRANRSIISAITIDPIMAARMPTTIPIENVTAAV